MLPLGMNDTLKKNRSILKALTSENLKGGGNTLQRGEVVYLHQTPARSGNKPHKLIGLVRDRNDGLRTAFINVYNDHLDNCAIAETSRLRHTGTSDWQVTNAMRVRIWTYEICDWDLVTGALTLVRGHTVIKEWQQLDTKGMPSAVQLGSASLMHVEFDGRVIANE